jgi:hypothetical protein
LVARLAVTGVKALAVLSLCLSALLLAFGQVRFSARALALTFVALAAARVKGVLPVTFRIRRARTDIAVALFLAVALATLALALPWGR